MARSSACHLNLLHASQHSDAVHPRWGAAGVSASLIPVPHRHAGVGPGARALPARPIGAAVPERCAPALPGVAHSRCSFHRSTLRFRETTPNPYGIRLTFYRFDTSRAVSACVTRRFSSREPKTRVVAVSLPISTGATSEVRDVAAVENSTEGPTPVDDPPFPPDAVNGNVRRYTRWLAIAAAGALVAAAAITVTVVAGLCPIPG